MKVLIANRGEIACRVAATLRKRNIPSVAIYSDVDAGARHVLMCDEAIGIGEPKAYLDIDKVLAAAKQVSATAVHPGYGFLAENAAFSQRCTEEGIRFIGPSPEAIDAFGDKGKRVDSRLTMMFQSYRGQKVAQMQPKRRNWPTK